MSEVHVRNETGREFQTVGAAKEKERRPEEDVILETVSRLRMTIVGFELVCSHLVNHEGRMGSHESRF